MEVIITTDYEKICEAASSIIHQAWNQFHPQAKIIVDEDASSFLTRIEYYKWVYKNKKRVKDFLK